MTEEHAPQMRFDREQIEKELMLPANCLPADSTVRNLL